MQRFTQRLVSSLLVPLLAWPVALLLLSAAKLTGWTVLQAAGNYLAITGVPLLFALGVAVGFAEGAPLAVVAAALAHLVSMFALHLVGPWWPPAFFGFMTGAVGVLAWRWCRRLTLPNWLGVFSGERLAPMLAVLLALPAAALWRLVWPWVGGALDALSSGLYALGPWGAALYAIGVRLLMPLGLHHLLTLVVDFQVGSYVAGGEVVHGELPRYLLGDPTAGRMTAAFIVTLGFCVPAAGLALYHAARPAFKAATGRRAWLSTLSATVIGATEGIELGLHASRWLRWTHVLLSGAVGYTTYLWGVRAHGYSVLMVALGLPLASEPLRLLVLGVAWAAVYYAAVRLIVAWQRPPVLGQVAPEAGEETPPASVDQWATALGGAANILAVDACMTRLRVQVAATETIQRGRLAAAGDGVVVQGRQVQVVLGSRAAAVRDELRALLATDAHAETVLLAPCAGRVVPLAQVPDAAFAQGLLGQGVAVDCQGDLVRAPAAGTVVAVFPGGHAIGIRTEEGLELLVHVGLNTAALQGDGFAPQVAEGDRVVAGQVLVRLDRQRLAALGVSLLTPVVVTNAGVDLLVTGEVAAGAPLLRVRA